MAASIRKTRFSREVDQSPVAPIDTFVAGSEEGLPPKREDEGSDSTGWPLEARERRDFYHTIRAFPAAVMNWREWMLEHIALDPERFSAVSKSSGIRAVRAALDDGISHLREIARILSIIHGTPRLGNHEDPVDELVYIILSRKTRESSYQKAFRALKDRFRSWADLLGADRSEVESLVRSGGLSSRKTDSLFGALSRIHETFGSCDLSALHDWPDDRVEEFLCSLPEISRKSAYCIMMYSLNRSAFPVDTHVGRVLTRLGPYRELGLDLRGLDHKKLQAVLAGIIPPNLRYSLHVNLVEHGRKVCTSGQPHCKSCDLRGFCSHFRQAESRKARATHAPTMVDLFCGAGGLSEGFERAGFKTLLSLDSDPVALRTYRLNHPAVPDRKVICADVREFVGPRLLKEIGKARLDVLVGAPPCQGYSQVGFRSKATKAGYSTSEDHRNFLYEFLIEAAVLLRPRLFLMENVPGMNSARREKLTFLESARKLLEQKAGYTTAIWRLNSSAFGVPQERIRLFLVGALDGMLPTRPPEEYQDLGRADFDVDALPPVTLDEAIFDLPPREANGGRQVDVREPADPAGNPRYRRYLSKFGLVDSSRLLTGHAVRYHNPQDLELYNLLKPGEDSIHFLERNQKAELMRYRVDVFDDKYARLRADRPCRTIVSHLAKDGNSFIHPTQGRSLTLREAARVQSFRDSYHFCGSASDQWVQVGNAVPPLLGEAIARTFLKALEQGEES
ncbi:MAG: DNA (cytosine-5-)-methyltransferase [Thermoanaerobaculia bacterium]|nr:DNA (cytosine-5-)-methyltransferase [Thermoanaerobaculia bacterium]